MTHEEVRKLANKLGKYFMLSGSQLPDANTISMWHSKLERVHSEACIWMAERMTDELKAFPKDNFPNVVKAFWMQWLAANPRSMEASFRRCADPWCEHGEIHAVKTIEGRPYVFAFSCTVCGQSRMAWPKAASIDLEASGYVRDCQEETSKRLAALPPLPKRTTRQAMEWTDVLKSWEGMRHAGSDDVRSADQEDCGEFWEAGGGFGDGDACH